VLENHRWKSRVKPVVVRGTKEEEDPLRGPRGIEGGLLTAVRLKRGRLWVGDGGELAAGGEDGGEEAIR
jgi:hypothetical protein